MSFYKLFVKVIFMKTDQNTQKVSKYAHLKIMMFYCTGISFKSMS